MSGLVEFILARIAEDEAVARAASPGGWTYGDVTSVAGGTLYDETRTIANIVYEQPEDHDGTVVRHLLTPEADANGRHIARHDPARVLAECEAKRRIVERCHAVGALMPCEPLAQGVLRTLALPHADHPDYRPEWRP